MRVCIIDAETNICVNIVELESPDEFIAYAPNIKVANNHTGEIGWHWNGMAWADPNVIEITEDMLIVRARNARDRLLKKHVDKINAVRWNSYTLEQQQAWQAYRNDLLNIPQQAGFPQNVIWPQLPQL